MSYLETKYMNCFLTFFMHYRQAQFVKSGRINCYFKHKNQHLFPKNKKCRVYTSAFSILC